MIWVGLEGWVRFHWTTLRKDSWGRGRGMNPDWGRGKTSYPHFPNQDLAKTRNSVVLADCKVR